MDPKPGDQTSEWRAVKWFALAATLVTAIGTPLLLQFDKGSVVYLLITVLLSVAGVVAKWSNDRKDIKIGASKEVYSANVLAAAKAQRDPTRAAVPR